MSKSNSTTTLNKRIKCKSCGTWPDLFTGICKPCEKLNNIRKNQIRPTDRPNVYQPPVPKDLAHTEPIGSRVKCEKCGSWKREQQECGHCAAFNSKAGIKRQDRGPKGSNVYLPKTGVDISETDQDQRQKCIECGTWKKVNAPCKLCSRHEKLRPKHDNNLPTYDPVAPTGVYVPPKLPDIASVDEKQAKPVRTKCSRCGSWEKDGVCGHCSKRETIIEDQLANPTVYEPPKGTDMRDYDLARTVTCPNAQCGSSMFKDKKCTNCGYVFAKSPLPDDRSERGSKAANTPSRRSIGKGFSSSPSSKSLSPSKPVQLYSDT